MSEAKTGMVVSFGRERELPNPREDGSLVRG